MEMSLCRDLVEFSPEGIVMINSQGVIKYLNTAAKDLFSYFEGEFKDSLISELFAPPEFAQQLSQNIQALQAQETQRPLIFGTSIQRSINEVFDVEIVLVEIGDNTILAQVDEDQDSIFTMYIRDVSVRKALQSQINQQASLDALTRINNRRSFYEKTKVEFRRSIRHPYPITMLLIGVDLFKSLNEKHGTQAGDQVLIALSDMLRQHLRDEDIVARMGNSEFAALLPHLTLSHAHKVGEKIRNYVEKTTIQNGDKYLRFTVSVGIVIWDKQEDFDQFMFRAHTALNNCIPKGRNCLSED